MQCTLRTVSGVTPPFSRYQLQSFSFARLPYLRAGSLRVTLVRECFTDEINPVIWLWRQSPRTQTNQQSSQVSMITDAEIAANAKLNLVPCGFGQNLPRSQSG